jgi:hypothetical protein
VSNRRKLKRTNPISQEIRSLDGARIRGGCDNCDAYQEVQADHYAPDVHRVVVYHDDWCPVLKVNA